MRSGRKKRERSEKTKDEIRFERMRWGWIGLVILSVGCYIGQSGAIGTVCEVIARQGEKEDEGEEDEE